MCTLQYFRRKSNLNIFLTHLLSDNTHPPPNKKKKQNKKHTHTHTHKRRFPTTQFFQTMQLRCNVLLAGLLVMLLERVHAQRCCNSKDHMSGCEKFKNGRPSSCSGLCGGGTEPTYKNGCGFLGNSKGRYYCTGGCSCSTCTSGTFVHPTTRTKKKECSRGSK